MPRPVPDPAKLDRAAELYLAGKTFKEAGAEVGLSSETTRIFLKRRGIEARSRSQRPGNGRVDPPQGVIEAYVGGESELAIAKRLGLSRTPVRRWLLEAGVEIRGNSAAGKLWYEGTTPEDRMAITSAAHAAVKGSTQTEEVRRKIAKTRERIEYGGRTSSGTQAFCDELDRRSIAHRREKAVGRYNVDVALSAYPIAVEVLGGNWHGAKLIHETRTPYILHEGWHLVFVWSLKRAKVTAGAVDQTIRIAEISGVNPPTVGQYWVLRGDGQVLASGHGDDDEFPLVPPSMRQLG